MIVQLVGNLTYPITIDPTVWIFDDRKILFDDAFLDKADKDSSIEDELKRTADRFARETFIKPPVNRSIDKFERSKLLTNTYVMPIKDFINTVEVAPNATVARLQTIDDEHRITIDQLRNSLLLFAKDGKPLKEDGPIHLYFGDGSNKHSPFKNIKKIIIE
ncbi:hypothetical protein [Aquibacillus salsiterrae]|uniref:Peptidyl-prolyl cis-trans isomerase n=1 Tax=Aquibacillus salsiterrae TaxID=2950439 RepID=A0A9X3WFK3_9BACI|nr:hypothetical protein [Aquibacillus salsiterrae]MDC3416519.1 hypothetical protein [Aquibacillus salsiterrae]